MKINSIFIEMYVYAQVHIHIYTYILTAFGI